MKEQLTAVFRKVPEGDIAFVEEFCRVFVPYSDQRAITDTTNRHAA
jgi:hypothetical protein